MLYLGFLVMIIGGFITSIALYYDNFGIALETVNPYYQGNEHDMEATSIILEKSTRELWELTHFHLYTAPVLLLVLAHLFLLSRGGSWRAWVVFAAWLFTILHIAGPWVVRATGAGWVMPVTGSAFLATYLIMAVWPLPDLLLGNRERGKSETE